MKKTYLIPFLLLFSCLFTNVYSQSATCAGANPFCAGGSTFTFPNTVGSASIGSPGCLGSAPNPAWFFMQIGQSGTINFQLTQGNNAPLYNNQDVDFIVWGPFAAPQCVGLYDLPDGNTLIPNNIVACSYSAAAIENFTLANVVVGQFYMVLITNFSNQSGQITLTQTNNPNIPGVGATSCDILCPLSLGPDVEVCPGTTTILTATIPSATSYVWTSTAAGFVNPGNVQSITVSAPGTYTVVVNKPGCVANSTASAVITVAPPPATAPPNNLIRCNTDPNFNLTTNTPIVLNGLTGYTISYHNTLVAAQDGTGGATIPNATNYPGTDGEIIYVSIEDNNTSCIITTSFTLTIQNCTCETISATNGNQNLCTGVDPAPFSVTTSETNVNSISYVYFNTPQTGSAMYTGGTLLGNVTPVANTAVYDAPIIGASGSLPDVAGTYYVYAILNPTPAIATCRSFQEIVVTVNTQPATPNPSDVTVCDSYFLPVLPAGSTYHSAPGGSLGTHIPANTSITTSQTIYIFAQSGTVPNCTAEGDFVVTVNTTPATPNPADVTICDSYTLPGLPAGQTYHTATGGTGTTLTAGTTITTTQTIYVFAQTGSTPNCTSEGDFVVTVNVTPTPDNPADVTSCGNYVLPALTVGNYFTGPNGTGTALFAGDAISTNQTIYVYAQTGTVPNCTAENSFDVTIIIAPTVNIPTDYVVCDDSYNNDGIYNDFDLLIKNTEITSDPTLTITYHETMGAAIAGGASYGNNYQNIDPGFQTIYVAVFNPAAPDCRSYTQFNLIVNPLPLVNPVITNYQLCDTTTPGDGVEIFTLNTKDAQIANGQTGVTITYYASLADATALTPGTALPNLYQNTTPNQQQIWVNIRNNTTGCSSVGTFNLIVNPLPTVVPPAPMFECSNGSVMTADFDLTLNNGIISGGNPGVTVTYYLTLADAQGETNPLALPYPNISNPQIIFVRVENNATGCYDTTTLELNVTQGPTANVPTPLEICDPNNDGFGDFNLTDAIADVVGGPIPVGVSVSFYETLTGAQLGSPVNALASPYTNIDPWTQTIYVRVFYTLTGCSNVVPLQLIVNPTPEATEPQDYHECDNDYDGFTIFDLSTINAEILGSIDPLTHTVLYYTSLAAAQLGDPAAAITSVTNYNSNNQIIYVRVTNTVTGCFDIVELQLIVDPLPTATQPAYVPYSLCETPAFGVGFESFDLLSQVPTILAGQTGVAVTFYPSLLDAQNGTNVIPGSSYVNTAIYVQTLGIRLTNVATGCFVISTIDIRVNPLPTPIPPITPPALCDADQDGTTDIDLDSYTAAILQGANYTITYHETLIDAQLGNNALISPYTSINPFFQVIYVSAVDPITGCRQVMPLSFTINPSPLMPTLTDLSLCDVTGNTQNGITVFDLTVQTPLILAAQVNAASNYTVTYYTSLANAQGQINNIVNTTTYTNTSNGQTIWVVVKHNTTGCFKIGTFQLLVNTPLLLTTPTPLSLCDNDANPNNLFTAFNLTVRDVLITGGLPGYTVTYYPSWPITSSSVAISDPTNYTNVSPAVQTLGVLVTSPQGCVSRTTLDIRVLPIPVPNTNPPALAPQCDYTNPGDLLEVFNLTTNAAYILNGDPSLTLHYYPTQADAIAQTNEILTPATALVGGNVWIRVENNRIDYLGNNCYVLVEQALTVNPLPLISAIPDYQICEEDAVTNDGFEVFDLTSQGAALLASNPTTSTYTLTYYADAALTNQITTPTAFTNTSNPQIIYVVATNTTTGCRSQVGQFNILVNPKPDIAQPTTLLNTCDSDGTNDGFFAYPLNGAVTTEVLNGQDPALFAVTFYNTEYNPDAGLTPTPIADLAGYMGYTHTIWAVVTNIATGCQKITSFAAVVEQLPEPEITTVDDIRTICVDFTDNVVVRTLTLTAVNNTVYLNPSLTPTFEYHWFEDNTEVAVTTTPTYTITQPLNDAVSSNFTVQMINQTALQCEQTSANFEVLQSGQAEVLNGTIGYTVTNAFTSNQIITVTVQGFGTYQYSLDDGPRQDSNIFENVSLGTHTITVWDTEGGLDNSCDEFIITEVQTIDYPHYFTPNGDGIHENWNIVGLSGQPSAKIYIFDRFSKLIKQISSTGEGWDGTFNGQPLPSTDYWFTVDYLEQGVSKQFKAHFSLKR